MKNNLICPILSITPIKNTFVPCQEEDCKWFHKASESCYITRISYLLYFLIPKNHIK